MAMTLKEILYDGYRVLTEAANRDGNGNVIVDTYATKKEVEDVNTKVNSIEIPKLQVLEATSLPEAPAANTIYIINGEQKVYSESTGWVTLGTTKFKTINGQSIFGDGNISIATGGSSSGTGSAAILFEEVNELPAVENAKSGTIYFVKSTTDDEEFYNEYVLFNNELTLFGSTYPITNIINQIKKLQENAITLESSLAEKAEKADTYTKDELDQTKYFYVNGEKITPIDKVVTLEAQQEYILSGYLDGHIIVDGSAIIDKDNYKSTKLILDGLYINSDVETAIEYTGKYKTLNIFLNKNQLNYVVCLGRKVYGGTESDKSKAAAIYAKEITETVGETTEEYQGNITIAGDGGLIIRSDGYNSHGIKGDNILITGYPHLYISTSKGHDGIHGNVTVDNGIIEIYNVNDGIGTGDNGSINIYGGHFYIDNITTGQLPFDSKQPGTIVYSDLFTYNNVENVDDLNTALKGTLDSHNMTIYEAGIPTATSSDFSIELGDGTAVTLNSDNIYELTTSYDNDTDELKENTTYYVTGSTEKEIRASAKKVRIVLDNAHCGAITYTNAKSKLILATAEHTVNTCQYIESTNNLTINNDGALYVLGNTGTKTSISGSTVALKGDGRLYVTKSSTANTYGILGTEILFGDEPSDSDIWISESQGEQSESSSSQYIKVLGSVYARLNSDNTKKGSIVFYAEQSGCVDLSTISVAKLPSTVTDSDIIARNSIKYCDNFDKKLLKGAAVYYWENNLFESNDYDYYYSNQQLVSKVDNLRYQLSSGLGYPLLTDGEEIWIDSTPATFQPTLVFQIEPAVEDVGIYKYNIASILDFYDFYERPITYISGSADFVDRLYGIFEDFDSTAYRIYIDYGGKYYLSELNNQAWILKIITNGCLLGAYICDDEKVATLQIVPCAHGLCINRTIDSSSNIVSGYLEYTTFFIDGTRSTIQSNIGASGSYQNAQKIANILSCMYYLYFDSGEFHNDHSPKVWGRYGTTSEDDDYEECREALYIGVDGIELSDLSWYGYNSSTGALTFPEASSAEEAGVSIITIPVDTTGSGSYYYRVKFRNSLVFNELCEAYCTGKVIIRAVYTKTGGGCKYFDMKFSGNGNTGSTDYSSSNYELLICAPRPTGSGYRNTDFVRAYTYNAITNVDFTKQTVGTQEITVFDYGPSFVQVDYNANLTTDWDTTL